jgi:hypothetical protein
MRRMIGHIQFNVLGYREGDWYVAQAIERDICSQARRPDEAIYELARAIATHIGYAMSRGEQPFVGLPATPAEIIQAWHNTVITWQVRPDSIEVAGNTPPPFGEIRYTDSIAA